MHFFYLDESGCTGADLQCEDQPIFVLGGLSIRDEGWNKTQEDFAALIADYFCDDVPDNFELHSHELLSPDGEGPFEGHPITERTGLASNVLDLIVERNHNIHLFAIHKSRIAQTECKACQNSGEAMATASISSRVTRSRKSLYASQPL